MIYYKSKYLSNNLQINLARWKRWSREFLPPDTLSGMQSGYARQFSLKEAFIVFLAGHLVGTFRFSIDEARRIMSDLSAWLKENGFHDMRPVSELLLRKPVENHFIFIFKTGAGHFGYVIRSLIHAEQGETSVLSSANDRTSLIGLKADPITQGSAVCARMICISALYLQFLRRLNSMPDKVPE